MSNNLELMLLLLILFKSVFLISQKCNLNKTIKYVCCKVLGGSANFKLLQKTQFSVSIKTRLAKL